MPCTPPICGYFSVIQIRLIKHSVVIAVGHIKLDITVFDLISEHALITEHPPFFFFFLFFFYFLFNFFFRDPVIIISGPSHATIFGSSDLHPG